MTTPVRRCIKSQEASCGKSISFALTALRLGSERKASVVDEAILLDARRQGAPMSAAAKKAPETTVLSIGATVRTAAGHAACELDQTGLAATARHSLCGPRTDGGQESVGRHSRATLSAGKERAGIAAPVARRVLMYKRGEQSEALQPEPDRLRDL
jgi:hypothetical protein